MVLNCGKLLRFGFLIFWIGEDVRDLHWLAFKHCSTNRRPATGRKPPREHVYLDPLVALARMTIAGRPLICLADPSKQPRMFCIAKPRCRF